MTAALTFLTGACKEVDCTANATCIAPDAGGSGDGGSSGSGAGGTAGKGGTGGKGGTAGKGGTGGSSGGSSGMAGQGGTSGEGGMAGDSGGECSDAEDGTECGGSGICINGQCEKSSCGDDFADTGAGEDCDAGEDNGTDGANCTDDCKWVCTSGDDCDATDCRDAGECQDHTCTEGAAKKDDLPCGANNGQVCKSGECVDKPCLGPEECADDTECTNDSCTDDFCVHAEQPSIDWYADCDSDGYAVADAQTENVLVADSCAMPAAAPDACGDGTWTKAAPAGDDVDCDDSDADVSPETQWYADCDGDEYAEGDAAIEVACLKPTPVADACTGIGTASWTRNDPTEAAGTDCDDTETVVNPGAAAWMETKIPDVNNTVYDFDYNCDGAETKRYTVVSTSKGACTGEASPSADSCATHTGWTGGTAPNCGADGSFVRCAFVTGACVATPSTTKQSCH